MAGMRPLASERLLVLWMDDVGFDADSEALVAALGMAEDLRALVVLTGAPDGAAERERVLDALNEEAMRELVRRSLGVSCWRWDGSPRRRPTSSRPWATTRPWACGRPSWCGSTSAR